MRRGDVILLNADAGRIPLPDGVVHCSVTSPPYWSLRQYVGEQGRDWPAVSYSPMIIPAMTCALGLEPTVEAYVGHLVACYREVWRVLRDDGVAWLNLGDSYASKPQEDNFADPKAPRRTANGRCRTIGTSAGNLLMIPHRVALALQADGWLVRNDCVWAKVAPMPESVAGTRWERHRVKISGKWNRGNGRETCYADDGHSGDIRNKEQPQWSLCPGCPTCAPTDGYVLRRGSWRHTRSHEVILMLTKKMNYWADQEAVREPGAEPDRQRSDAIGTIQRRLAGRPVDRVATATTVRNPRSVLTPRPSGGYSGQHYATFPPDLIGPLLRATCPSRCCPVCGAGHAPVVEKPDMSQRPTRSNGAKYPTNGTEYSDDGGGTLKSAGQAYQEWRDDNPDVVLGYRLTCACQSEGELISGLVLDPFVGSGTTALVARELGLRCVGLDLSGEYLSQQAAVRVLNRTPAGAMEDLPLFAAGEYADA